MSMATQMKLRFNAKERVLLGMTSLLLPIVLVEVYAISGMRAAPVFQHPDMPQKSDFATAMAISLVIVALRYGLTAAFKPIGRRVLSPAKRINEDRVERFATVLFKFLYFISITAAGYYVMKDEDWFPTVLGGSGSVANAYRNAAVPPTPQLKLYFLVQLGYHFHSLVYMLLLSPIRNDFLEMMLHHVVTIILIGGSFLANYAANGALVAYVHDIGDVTGYAIKSVVDTGYTPLVLVFYLLLLVSWGWSRLYVYPVHLLYPTIHLLPEVNPDVPMIFLRPGNVLLGMLQVLHIYWYGLFLFMGYMLLKSGKQEDIQQEIDDSNDNKDTTKKQPTKKKDQ